jgi:hypothetical protein
MPYAKKRRTGAVAAEHQRIVASLKRTVLVMLPAWLAFLGCALAFPMLVVLMMRAYATSRGA